MTGKQPTGKTHFSAWVVERAEKDTYTVGEV